MKRVDTAIVGGGQAGLAMSRCLSDHGIDHVVVGAASSGVQIADELAAAGRDVVFDVVISRQQPSLQLFGRPDAASLNLATLQDRGVRIVGRLMTLDGHLAIFDDDLIATAADTKLALLLVRLDEFAAREPVDVDVAEGDVFAHTWSRFTTVPTRMNLRDEGITTIVWAVGYRRRYDWLRVPVLDAAGEIQHDGGVTAWPGLYVIGLRFLRRRNSTFIDGVGKDAVVLAAHVAGYLGHDDQAVA